MFQQRSYQFHELLGRGGMGEVYRGTFSGAHGFELPVAIKRLRRELAEDEHFVARLVEEAKLLVGLRHSRVVGVLDLGRSDGEVFVVLEFIDGPDLGQLLGAKPISLGLVCFVVHAACEGVAFAHRRENGSIVHADLSPANILLTRAGEVKVTDFGIARRAGRDTGGIEGKWPYMSPEQTQGAVLSPQSDVFSMGVVLYEVLTGRRPFHGDTQEALIAAVIGEAPPPPSALREGLPEQLDACCLQALAKDPSERFDSIAALGACLNEVAFNQGWREGAAELAAAIEERVPRPRLDKASVDAQLAALGISDESTCGTKPAGQGELTGSVQVHTALFDAKTLSTVPQGARAKSVSAPSVAPGAGRHRFAYGMSLGVIAAAGLGLFFFWGGGEAKVPAATVARSEALDASVKVTQDTLPVVTMPRGAADAAPRRMEDARALRDVQSVSKRPPVARKRAKAYARKRKRPAIKGTGVLRIHSEPWGNIWVDGKRTRHYTPAVIELSIGRHKVRVRNPATGRQKTLTVQIAKGQTSTKTIVLNKP